MTATTVRWPVRELTPRPHRHDPKYIWLDSDDVMWRCEVRGCRWSRSAEGEECWWLPDHEWVPSVVTDLADIVCVRCGAIACLVPTRLRVVE